MAGFYISKGWESNSFDEQIVKFQKFQIFGVADRCSQMTIYLVHD